MNRRETGAEYEQIAATFLEDAGYQILERNYYTAFGEIDLIAKDQTTLVFIEVKYRTSDKTGFPEESVTPGKQRRIRKCAQYYLYQHNFTTVSCRFDVIAILNQRIRHIKNAF